ncbi:MAG: hypothetical protein JRE64_20540 [Deltaproteobacteria bacterium]|nr:hypothetical protein [Deltaproteobacteria bacterium]
MTLFYYPALQYTAASCERQKGSPAKVVRKDQSDESGEFDYTHWSSEKRDWTGLEADIHKASEKQKNLLLTKGGLL